MALQWVGGLWSSGCYDLSSAGRLVNPAANKFVVDCPASSHISHCVMCALEAGGVHQNCVGFLQGGPLILAAAPARKLADIRPLTHGAKDCREAGKFPLYSVEGCSHYCEVELGVMANYHIGFPDHVAETSEGGEEANAVGLGHFQGDAMGVESAGLDVAPPAWLDEELEFPHGLAGGVVQDGGYLDQVGLVRVLGGAFEVILAGSLGVAE